MRNDTKDVLEACRTCSRTFAHLLNRNFGYMKEEEELAMNPLAVGVINQGFQCGILWGASLAVCAETYRKRDTLGESMAAAVAVTREVMQSFLKETHTVNCKEIIGFDLSTKTGIAQYMAKVTAQALLEAFKSETHGKMRCSAICGQNFSDL